MIDVCLILEGTYPYVSGGVSVWVHQLISAMKDIRFGIVYIAPHADPTRKPKFELPQNVIYLSEINLHDYALDIRAKRSPKKKDVQLLRRFYDGIMQENFGGFESIAKLFRGPTQCFDFDNFFSSHAVWEEMVSLYDKMAPDYSFLDFFWTWRGIHLPIIQAITADLPHARVYHAISTGYAGLLGALAKIEFGEKFFLTEHGIYTHERMLEIAQANWIYEIERTGFRAERDLSVFKKWWIGVFKVMSALTYHHADRIFTLYEGNRIREVLEGAAPEKISIIPNGIDVAAYDAIIRAPKKTRQIGFVGRVVSIKDPKTFIQAARMVLDSIPDSEFLIMGPTDEEEEYFVECKALVEALHLEERVKFLGPVNVREYYAFLDLVVLTSISEAQPYVILEANAAGIPVVAPDIGGCREMIEGRSGSDSAIGPSGVVTEVSNSESTATAILLLLQDVPFYDRCAEAGRTRVRRYYDQDDLLSRYLNVYEQGM